MFMWHHQQFCMLSPSLQIVTILNWQNQKTLERLLSHPVSTKIYCIPQVIEWCPIVLNHNFDYKNVLTNIHTSTVEYSGSLIPNPLSFSTPFFPCRALRWISSVCGRDLLSYVDKSLQYSNLACGDSDIRIHYWFLCMKYL